MEIVRKYEELILKFNFDESGDIYDKYINKLNYHIKDEYESGYNELTIVIFKYVY